MAANSINIAGKKLKIVHYNEPIYRADKETFALGRTALQNYRNAPMKYFTLNKAELKSYTLYQKPWMKTWEPQEPLILIDILHKPTRDALGELIGKESLNVAFPIKGNIVSRVSEEHTRIHDDNVLGAICELEGLDGYYMKRLDLNNVKFHSEIGLCPNGFSKLVLRESEKNRTVAPAVKRNNNNMGRSRGKSRRGNLNNSNSNNSNIPKFRNFSNLLKSPNTTRKKPRSAFAPLKFNNNELQNTRGPMKLENLFGPK